MSAAFELAAAQWAALPPSAVVTTWRWHDAYERPRPWVTLAVGDGGKLLGAVSVPLAGHARRFGLGA